MANIDLVINNPITVELNKTASFETLELTKTEVTLELIKSPVSVKGDKGLSAYEVAVKNGFIGTELEWLDSLKTDKVQWNSTNW